MSVQTQNNVLVYDVTAGSSSKETPPITIPEKMSVILVSASGIATGFVSLFITDDQYRRSFVVGSGIGGFAIDLITNSLGGNINQIRAGSQFSFINGGSHLSALGTPITLDPATTGLVFLQFKDRR